jgi:hypothetical protein
VAPLSKPSLQCIGRAIFDWQSWCFPNSQPSLTSPSGLIPCLGTVYMVNGQPVWSLTALERAKRGTIINAGATICDSRAHGANGALGPARPIDRQFLVLAYTSSVGYHKLGLICVSGFAQSRERWDRSLDLTTSKTSHICMYILRFCR